MHIRVPIYTWVCVPTQLGVHLRLGAHVRVWVCVCYGPAKVCLCVFVCPCMCVPVHAHASDSVGMQECTRVPTPPVPGPMVQEIGWSHWWLEGPLELLGRLGRHLRHRNPLSNLISFPIWGASASTGVRAGPQSSTSVLRERSRRREAPEE